MSRSMTIEFESPMEELIHAAEVQDALFESPVEELERDQYQRPLVDPPVGGWLDAGNPKWAKDEKRYGGRRPYQRISTFASELDNGAGLAIWKGRHIATQTARERNADIRAVLAGLRYEGKDFKQIDQMIEELLTRGGAEEASLSAANWGTAIHRFAEPYSPPDMPERLEKDVKAYLLEHRRKRLRIVDTEVHVVNDELGVSGTFDTLVQLPIEPPCCPTWAHHQVEWDPTCDRWYCLDCARPLPGGPNPDLAETRLEDKKTGKLHFQGQAIQLATYANGSRYDLANKNEKGEVPRLPIHPHLSLKWATLAHIPLGSGTCVLYRVDIEWGLAQARIAAAAREGRREEKTAFSPWA